MTYIAWHMGRTAHHGERIAPMATTTARTPITSYDLSDYTPGPPRRSGSGVSIDMEVAHWQSCPDHRSSSMLAPRTLSVSLVRQASPHPSTLSRLNTGNKSSNECYRAGAPLLRLPTHEKGQRT